MSTVCKIGYINREGVRVYAHWLSRANGAGKIL